MNNFQKFSNKQLSVEETTKVVGGIYEECLNAGPGNFCLFSTYMLNVSMMSCSLIDMGPIGYRLCLDAACDAAQAECIIQ